MRSTSFDEGAAGQAAILGSQDLARLRELQRAKLLAAVVLTASLVLLVLAKLLERRFSGFAFLAAFAEAAAIGGLADCYSPRSAVIPNRDSVRRNWALGCDRPDSVPCARQPAAASDARQALVL
jgi:hypothetical protein